MPSREYERAEAHLLDKRRTLERRLEAIKADRRRASAPFEKDSDDQAIQRENDEALDALDEQGRIELADIGIALERLAAGTYGRCARCDEAIDSARLRSEPATDVCIVCARESETR